MISNKLEFELYILKLEANIKTLQTCTLEGLKRGEVISNIAKIYNNLQFIRKIVFLHLTAWQHIEISRNFSRPSSKDYINAIFSDFQELLGDRICSNDKAIIGGIANLNKCALMIIGQQKGMSLQERSENLFGMTSPSGFRKSLRLMEIAERFNLPIITLIDTPGADPGISAERNNQSCAIAYNLLKMPQLKVPIISIVIGEGCSGGALAVGTGDVLLMLQYSYYSILAPEGCSLILQGTKDNKERFSDILCLTSEHLYNHGLVHDVISEHRDNRVVYELLRTKVQEYVTNLLSMDREVIVNRRLNYWKSTGFKL